MINKQDTLQDAICHLRGYSLLVRANTGYNPMAVSNCIKKLKAVADIINSKLLTILIKQKKLKWKHKKLKI